MDVFGVFECVTVRLSVASVLTSATTLGGYCFSGLKIIYLLQKRLWARFLYGLLS